MGSDFDAQLREEARPFLEPGEEIAASIVAQPRGTSTAMSGGGAAGAIGSAWAGKSQKGGEGAGLAITNPMALAVSDRRVLVFGIEKSGMGKPKGVTGLVSAAPVSDVDEIKVKGLLVGKVVTIRMGGQEVKLEVGGGQDAKGLAAAFDRAKAGA